MGLQQSSSPLLPLLFQSRVCAPKRIRQSSMLSVVGRDRLCFARLVLLALLFMQEYSIADVSADTVGVDQRNPEVSEANATAGVGQQSTGQESATEELIAG